MPVALNQFSIIANFAVIALMTVVVQLLAWRFRLPLLLLTILLGLGVGPGIGLVNPELLFGDWFVALLILVFGFHLFEQGIRLHRFTRSEIVVSALTAAISWVCITLLSQHLLELSFPTSCFVGAALAASGPVVVTPLFRHLSLRGALGPTLRVESAVTEVVAIVLASVSALLFDGARGVTTEAALRVGKVGVIVVLIALVGTIFLRVCLKRELLPDFLRAPTVATFVFGVIAAASLVEPNMSLFAAATFGVFLGRVPGAWSEMRDELRVFLLTFLTLLLAARMNLEPLAQFELRHLFFLAALILVVRPLAVGIATFRRAEFSGSEKAFLAAYSPRGVFPLCLAYLFSTDLFSSELLSSGFGEGELLARAHLNVVVLLVVVGTSFFYTVASPFIARALSVSEQNSNGVLIVGAHHWARELAQALMQAKCRVLLVDTNQLNILAARREGIPARCANVFLDRTLDEVALEGFGFLLALTSNDEVNTLSTIHFADIFGTDRVFQLSLDAHKSAPDRFRKHLLFGRTVTFEYLEDRFSAGAVIRAVPVTQELDILGLHETYGQDTVPFFALGKGGELSVFTPERWPVLAAGHTLICLMEPGQEGESEEGQRGKILYLNREGG